MRCLVALALVLALCAPGREARAGDGNLEWLTIESEHFIISYHAPLGKVARRLASLAERAHEILVPEFGKAPDEKTLIVLDDLTDSSNGFASVLPRNAIGLFASAPPSKSDLADHDDWLFGLVAHEYTHILHLDVIDGLPKWVNRVIGKTWAPNQVQPRWIIEGLATYEESRHTSGGRLRHNLFRTLLRTATLENDERGLDEMSNGPRAWPHGNTAYLYGSHFLQYVFDRFGNQAVAEMSYTYGSNPIPYAINRAIRQATGHDFGELHDDWKAYRRGVYGMELEAIERAGRREGRRLTFTSEININPRFTRDGKSVIWQHGPGDSLGDYSIMPIDGDYRDRKSHAVVRRGGEFDVLSDNSLIVEQTEIFRAAYTSQELWRWDIKSQRLTQLTRRTRMRDPAVSPDETQVAFVSTANSERRLAVMNLVPGAEPKVIWQGGSGYDQALDPAWSPDGKSVAFSAWRQGGFRDILIVEVETGKVRELYNDRASDIDPVFDPNGRYLYFSSDRTGIFNVFAYELATGDLFQVTNVLGCAVASTVSPDGTRMVYQGMVARGFELYSIALDRSAWTPADIYISDRPDSVVIDSDEYPVTEPRPYDPRETLAPQRYDLQADLVNGLMNLQITGTDAVGMHRFNLGGTANLQNGRVDIGGTYSYSRLWAGLNLGAARSLRERGGLVIDHRNRAFLEEALGLTASVSLPVLRTAKGSGSIALDYDFDYLRQLDSPYEEPDPNQPVPTFPETDVMLSGLALRFSYSDTAGFAYTLGPQLGHAFSVSMRLDHPALGSDFRSLTLAYLYQTFWKLPFGRTPVMLFRLGGGLRTTDRSSTPRFVLGGVPQQDVAQALLNNLRGATTGFLRGYEPRAVSGTQMHLLNLEYRQELWNVERGLSTLPLYIRKIHMAGLFDLGSAYDDEFAVKDLRPALGLSLRSDLLFGYFVPGSLDLGYARGLGEDGIHEFWTLVTGNI